MVHSESKQIVGAAKSELIYADKVLGVGIGAGVSKIILGLENIDGEMSRNTALVLPTQALIDLVELVGKSLKTNHALKTQLIQQWKTLADKFEAEAPGSVQVEKSTNVKSK